jgi:hypothetical protein
VGEGPDQPRGASRGETDKANSLVNRFCIDVCVMFGKQRPRTDEHCAWEGIQHPTSRSSQALPEHRRRRAAKRKDRVVADKGSSRRDSKLRGSRLDNDLFPPT